jgi:multidrug efflux pump subunit AcrA (membrane-fusion protein)
MPDVRWQGRIARISPSSDASTRTFTVYVEVDNTRHPHELMPGFFVRATVEGPSLENVLIVPRGCIEDRHAYVYHDGAARLRPVHIVRHLLDRTIVTGLEAEDVLITSNLDILHDGSAVRLSETSTAGSVGGAGVALDAQARADKE